MGQKSRPFLVTTKAVHVSLLQLNADPFLHEVQESLLPKTLEFPGNLHEVNVDLPPIDKNSFARPLLTNLIVAIVVVKGTHT